MDRSHPMALRPFSITTASASGPDCAGRDALAHSLDDGPAKYRVSRATSPSRNSMMLTVAGWSAVAAKGSPPDLAEYTHPVVKGDLAQCRIIEAVRAQRLDQIRQMARIPDRKRHGRAIEIGPERNVVVTHPLDEVAEVGDHHLDGNVGI